MHYRVVIKKNTNIFATKGIYFIYIYIFRMSLDYIMSFDIYFKYAHLKYICII